MTKKGKEGYLERERGGEGGNVGGREEKKERHKRKGTKDI